MQAAADHVVDGAHLVGDQTLDWFEGSGAHRKEFFSRGFSRQHTIAGRGAGGLCVGAGAFDHTAPGMYTARLFRMAFRDLAMYAVIKTGGKQYKVSAGEKLKVESIPAEVGAEITLDQVLMVADGEKVSMGTPLVAGASVKATVVGHGRGEKVKIFKLRRRKHYRKTLGHRQNFTEIQINGISA